jgi:hypothetical protein
MPKSAAGRRNDRRNLVAAGKPDPLRPVGDFPYGDVTVLGSVSSGAEVVAGGRSMSMALRGEPWRLDGQCAARIFCSKNEAELISIDVLPHRRGHGRKPAQPAAQCWLMTASCRLLPWKR